VAKFVVALRAHAADAAKRAGFPEGEAIGMSLTIGPEPAGDCAQLWLWNGTVPLAFELGLALLVSLLVWLHV